MSLIESCVAAVVVSTVMVSRLTFTESVPGKSMRCVPPHMMLPRSMHFARISAISQKSRLPDGGHIRILLCDRVRRGIHGR